MLYRQAQVSDYEALHAVRMAVKENILVNTNLVTFDHYKDILEEKGCGWVCENESGEIIGFSMVDLALNNIWALFILPNYQGQGIGRHLHQLMLDWSFMHGAAKLWLTTDAGTRAENFYLKSGWQRKGLEPNGELRFEISKEIWLLNKTNKVKAF